MRSAIALALLAAGAILTFTVSAQVPGISLRGAGVIIILTGVAALLMPPSPAADWLRRQAGAGPPAGAADGAAPAEPEDAYPDYLLQDPAVLAAEVLNGIRSDGWRQEPEQHHGERHPPADRHHGASHHGASQHGASQHDASHHGDQHREQHREQARPPAARRTLYSVRGLDRQDGVG